MAVYRYIGLVRLGVRKRKVSLFPPAKGGLKEVLFGVKLFINLCFCAKL